MTKTKTKKTKQCIKFVVCLLLLILPLPSPFAVGEGGVSMIHAVTYKPLTSTPSVSRSRALATPSSNHMASSPSFQFQSTSVMMPTTTTMTSEQSSPLASSPVRSVRRDANPFGGFGALDELEEENEIGVVADPLPTPVGEPLILLCLAGLYFLRTFIKKRSTSTK